MTRHEWVALVTTTNDAALSRPGTSRRGHWVGARRGGLSLGMWDSAATAPDWQLLCMGTLEVHQDRLVFLGKATTELIQYADVLGVRRGPAVNQWGVVLPEFARVVLHRTSRGPIALSCTHAIADVIEASVKAFQLPLPAAAPATSALTAANPGALVPTPEGEIDWEHPVFRGTIIASTHEEGGGDRPLGCAATFSFSEDGVALACAGYPTCHLFWDEVTAVAYSGDRYMYPEGTGDLPQHEALLEAGIHQGRARVLVADAANEWVVDAAWLPHHKDLLDAIQQLLDENCDLEPR